MQEEERNCTEKQHIVRPRGRIDSNTAPLFSEAIGKLEGVEDLLLDFQHVEFISSAGIRHILTAYKIMRNQGSMRITGVNEAVYSALYITGFTDKLTIERAG